MQNCPDVQIWRRGRLCPSTAADHLCRGHEARRVVVCRPPSGLEGEPQQFLFIDERAIRSLARLADPQLA